MLGCMKPKQRRKVIAAALGVLVAGASFCVMWGAALAAGRTAKILVIAGLVLFLAAVWLLAGPGQRA